MKEESSALSQTSGEYLTAGNVHRRAHNGECSFELQGTGLLAPVRSSQIGLGGGAIIIIGPRGLPAGPLQTSLLLQHAGQALQLLGCGEGLCAPQVPPLGPVAPRPPAPAPCGTPSAGPPEPPSPATRTDSHRRDQDGVWREGLGVRSERVSQRLVEIYGKLCRCYQHAAKGQSPSFSRP